MKKAMRSLVAILLVLSILVSGQEPLLNAAADSALGPVYVADVQLFQASTLDECVQDADARMYEIKKRKKAGH